MFVLEWVVMFCFFPVVCCWCFFVIFFFCKQKTAYEMRISDWSSDVCSSDLALRVAALDLQLGQGLQLLGLVFGHVHDEIFAARDHLGHQIGRASCRERVCQYV